MVENEVHIDSSITNWIAAVVVSHLEKIGAIDDRIIGIEAIIIIY